MYTAQQRIERIDGVWEDYRGRSGAALTPDQAEYVHLRAKFVAALRVNKDSAEAERLTGTTWEQLRQKEERLQLSGYQAAGLGKRVELLASIGDGTRETKKIPPQPRSQPATGLRFHILGHEITIR